MKKIKIYASILLVASLGTACEEDEPLLSLPQLLDGRQWELESRTIEQPDGSVENVAIDYCDIELWEFESNVLSVDYHFISLAGEECVEEDYSLSQSYRLRDDEVLWEGDQQELTQQWDALGFTLSDMQIVRLSNQRIRITYYLTETGLTEPAARTKVTDTHLLHATTKHPSQLATTRGLRPLLSGFMVVCLIGLVLRT